MNFLFDNKNKKNFNCHLRYLIYLDGKIYFKLNESIELIEDTNDKIEIKDLGMSSNIYFNGIHYHCKIIEKPYEQGLKINIEYDNNIELSSIDKKEIAMYIELCILEISSNEDSSYIEDFNNDYEKKIQDYLNNKYDESDDEEDSNIELLSKKIDNNDLVESNIDLNIEINKFNDT